MAPKFCLFIILQEQLEIARCHCRHHIVSECKYTVAQFQSWLYPSVRCPCSCSFPGFAGNHDPTKNTHTHSKWEKTAAFRQQTWRRRRRRLTHKNNARIFDRMAFIRIAAGSIHLHFRALVECAVDRERSRRRQRLVHWRWVPSAWMEFHLFKYSQNTRRRFLRVICVTASLCCRIIFYTFLSRVILSLYLSLAVLVLFASHRIELLYELTLSGDCSRGNASHRMPVGEANEPKNKYHHFSPFRQNAFGYCKKLSRVPNPIFRELVHGNGENQKCIVFRSELRYVCVCVVSSQHCQRATLIHSIALRFECKSNLKHPNCKRIRRWRKWD